MAVLVLVLDVLVIVQNVRMRMCHVPVGVLMGVLIRRHLFAPFPAVSVRDPRNHVRMDGAPR